MRKRPVVCVNTRPYGMLNFCRESREWIRLRNSSGFFQFFLLYCLDICCAAQSEHLSFMRRLLPDAVCLQPVRLGEHF
jgi:hypothetical protein